MKTKSLYCDKLTYAYKCKIYIFYTLNVTCIVSKYTFARFQNYHFVSDLWYEANLKFSKDTIFLWFIVEYTDGGYNNI